MISPILAWTLLASAASEGSAPLPLPLPLALHVEAANLSPAPQEEGRLQPPSFSYTYVEGGMIRFEVDDIDDNVDILYLRGSLAFLDFLHVFAEYQNQEADFGNSETDLIELGVGGHFGIMPNLDLLAELSWLLSDVSSDIGALDEQTNGYKIFGGGRWMVLPWHRGGLELDGGVGYLDLEDQIASEDNTFLWELGARAHFVEIMSVGVEYSELGDDNQIAGDLRVSF